MQNRNVKLMITLDESPLVDNNPEFHPQPQMFSDGRHGIIKRKLIDLDKTSEKYDFNFYVVNGKNVELFKLPFAYSSYDYTGIYLTVVPGSSELFSATVSGEVRIYQANFVKGSVKKISQLDHFDRNSKIRYCEKMVFSEDGLYAAIGRVDDKHNYNTLLLKRENNYRYSKLTYLADCGYASCGKWLSRLFVYTSPDNFIKFFDPVSQLKYSYDPCGPRGWSFLEREEVSLKKSTYDFLFEHLKHRLGENDAKKYCALSILDETKLTEQVQTSTSFSFFVSRMVVQYATTALDPELNYPEQIPMEYREAISNFYSQQDKKYGPDMFDEQKHKMVKTNELFVKELLEIISKLSEFTPEKFHQCAITLLSQEKFALIQNDEKLLEMMSQLAPQKKSQCVVM